MTQQVDYFICPHRSSRCHSSQECFRKRQEDSKPRCPGCNRARLWEGLCQDCEWDRKRVGK